MSQSKKQLEPDLYAEEIDPEADFHGYNEEPLQASEDYQYQEEDNAIPLVGQSDIPVEERVNDEAYDYVNGEVDRDWVQYFDEDTGYPYLYNEITGEAKWIDPETFNVEDLQINIWEKYFDDDGNPFYYNRVRIHSSLSYSLSL